MRKLIKLELAKNNIRPYLLAVLGITAAMIGFTYFFAEVPNMEANETAEFGSYLDVVLIVSVLSMASFCILSAVMFSRFVIDEYNGKRAILLFSYPVNRRKVLAAKLTFVCAFIFIGFLVSNTVVFALFNLTEYFAPIVKEGVLSDAIRQAALLILVEAFLAESISVIALFLGFLRKSVPVAIVTAVVLCSPVSNFGSPMLMAIAMAACAVTAAVLIVVLSGRVNAMEA
ncbi:MAG: ABC transporter permease [Clostridiales Family XIII bacterium]|jgi:ABC-type transport system involved in multi-copper enzyme maturation permease subunit|nr:ABC transporter permease [Clostridiales Family XIII bacterium]